MSKFFIDNGFGGKDEQKMQDHFEELVGGVARATQMLNLWNQSYQRGTMTDFLQGHGTLKKQAFERAAKREGFTQEMIDCFYEL